MKKMSIVLCSLLFCVAGLYAEHIKFTVAGPEKRYNQIKVVNNTKASDFDCIAYFLEERGDKYIAQEAIGVFHLQESGSSDTCNYVLQLIKKGLHIGLDVPEEVGPVTYVLSYKDYLLFDAIEITLISGESPVGKEF